VDTGRLARDREDPRLIVATRADLLKLRRAAVLEALRKYRVALGWARATEWLTVGMAGYGAWLTVDGQAKSGALMVLAAALGGMVCRALQRRIRAAQWEAYYLLEWRRG
jgi:hypothetical protein